MYYKNIVIITIIVHHVPCILSVCNKKLQCLNQPCVNGNCTDLKEDYRCDCSPGFTGKNCDININECLNNPCQNNGTCVDKINDYECQCTADWGGKNCNVSKCIMQSHKI